MVARTSVRLTDQEKKAIKKILSAKLGRELSLEEKLDETLIVGLLIEIGSLIIDGSLRNRLKKAVRYLKKE